MGDTEPGTAWYINYEMLVEEEISVIGEYTSLLRLYIYVYETNIVFDFYVLTHIWLVYLYLASLACLRLSASSAIFHKTAFHLFIQRTVFHVASHPSEADK